MTYTKTTQDIVFQELQNLVFDNKAVTSLDAASFAIGLATKYRLNPNTVCRARRRYIAEQLHRDLVRRENKAFKSVLNNILTK